MTRAGLNSELIPVVAVEGGEKKKKGASPCDNAARTRPGIFCAPKGCSGANRGEENELSEERVIVGYSATRGVARSEFTLWISAASNGPAG